MKIEIDCTIEELNKIGEPVFLTEDQKRMIMFATREYVVKGSKEDGLSADAEIILLHEHTNIAARLGMPNFNCKRPSYFDLSGEEIDRRGGTRSFLEPRAEKKLNEEIVAMKKASEK